MSKWIKNWFSNMMPMPIMFYQGIAYLTVENFYQAMKLPKDRIDLRREIANMVPHKAKVQIRNKEKYPWRADWTKEESLKVMEYALRHKFKEGSEWANTLLKEEGEIVEWNNWGDKFWGKDVETKEGENHLGKILMKIREELLSSSRIFGENYEIT